MKPKPLLKRIKMILVFFLLLILSGIAFSLFRCMRSVGRTEILAVRTQNLKERTYRFVDVGENRFQTGSDGRLYWKVKNLKEAFLIALADRDSSGNFYDLFYFLVLDASLFMMVYKVREETIISNQLYAGLTIVAYSVMLYPFIIFASYYIAENSIEALTGNQFTAQQTSFNTIKYMYLAYLMIFMSPFLKKAIELQKQQDLTI